MRSGKPFSAGKSSFKGKNPKDSSTFRGYGQNEDRNVFQKPNHEEQDGKDEKLGFPRYSDVQPKLGWLLNIVPVTIQDERGVDRSGLDLYFLEQDGGSFKSSIFYFPYFYLGILDESNIMEAVQYLNRKFDSYFDMRADVVDVDDLDLANHLSGKKRKIIRLSFAKVADLVDVRNQLRPMIQLNQKRSKSSSRQFTDTSTNISDFQRIEESFFELREFDVPYIMRVCIDLNIRVGSWYNVRGTNEVESIANKELDKMMTVANPNDANVTPNHYLGCTLDWQQDMVEKGQPRIFAFDIECTKSPLKFPDARVDQVYMISIMTDKQGFLIINKEFVVDPVPSFEYSPKQDITGKIDVITMDDENGVLREFLRMILDYRPHVFVTYNGDIFDWPFVTARSKHHGIPLLEEIDLHCENGINGVEFRGHCSVHLDCMAWVRRDSYLPQGSQGLKAVTRYKLGYDPVEVDPEDMLRLARENSQQMASYSVSDAVATYYLYRNYVHLFVFSLCTIIPYNSEDVLRKGSGTLCEALLMTEAKRKNIICPNKQADVIESLHEGHLVESETYIGGHVESLETGIFRSDIDTNFHLSANALKGLVLNVERDMKFFVEVEAKASVSDIVDFHAVKDQIIQRLTELSNAPNFKEKPKIYHLDVGAMYPNIILTNRLQPCSIVHREDCANCDFNRESNNCKRPMKWTWRGDYSPASSSEYNAIKTQLSYEMVGGKPFHELPQKDQSSEVRSRLSSYCKRVYRKSKVTTEEPRTDVVCMRENSFYVDTVRLFRDRRYEYKVLTKKWRKEKLAAEQSGNSRKLANATEKELIYESLQIAHKCILNSFYGYVMRKGARWRSMEMAGIVTYTGAELIKQAREMVECVGRPLELDTDGIWCMLPASFPDQFSLTQVTRGDGGSVLSSKTLTMSYPCAMLNADVHERHTNHQYQVLSDERTRSYDTSSECSIFFELDGPYHAMLLPASTEEGKTLKKRYAVFSDDGTLKELKGFELKRRGELELIKSFQAQVFDQFLQGSNLEECYKAVALVADQWIDVIETRGMNLEDEEVIELISENKRISQTLGDYSGRKATALTTASRLADFLGPDMIKDKGLNCRLVISQRPYGAPVTERAIPTAIFAAEPEVLKYFLKRWLKDPGMTDFDIRSIIDWDYYLQRLSKSIQKIVVIPATFQKLDNPVPRVQLPAWLEKKIQRSNDGMKQLDIVTLFGRQLTVKRTEVISDIEDFGSSSKPCEIQPPKLATVRRAIETVIEEPAKQVLPLLHHFPDTKEEFNDWLDNRKTMWREMRREKKRQALAERSGKFGSAAKGHDKLVKGVPMNVQDFIKHAADTVKHGYWQIIEIQELSAGEFLLWAMTDQSSIQRLRLSVKRKLLVNFRRDPSVAKESPGKRVNRFLPHGHKCKYLFEIEVSEKKFQKSGGVMDLLNQRDIEGVYESKFPLSFMAVMKVGCLGKLTDSAKHSMAASGLRNQLLLDEINPVSPNMHPYLSPDVAVWRRVFIYYSMASNGKRGLVSVFVFDGDNRQLPSETSSQEPESALNIRAFVWLTGQMTSPGQFLQEGRPPLQRIFQRLCPNSKHCCKFHLTLVDSVETALKQASNDFHSEVGSRNAPTIVFAQGPLSTSAAWRSSMACLNEYPVVCMPGVLEDDRYPALGWQTFASERMIERLFLLNGWINDRLSCSRYSHVPIGNLTSDAPSYMTDILYGRVLQKNRHVSWASNDSKPDLGGMEEDEYDLWSEEHGSSAISNPNLYRSYCVELKIQGLVVGAIMSSSLLDSEGITNVDTAINDASETDGSKTLGSKKQNNDGNLELPEECAAAVAFKLLKMFTTNLVRDVVSSSNPYADALLIHFYRWICADSIYLKDPALQRLVLSLMTKLFRQLVGEFCRLGAQIVFANFSRMIICTGRYSIEEAVEYMNYIVETISTTELFKFLRLIPCKTWEQLIFLDSYNFGGISVSVDPADVTHALDQKNDDMGEDTVLPGLGESLSPRQSREVNTDVEEEAEFNEDEDDNNESSNESDTEHQFATSTKKTYQSTKSVSMIDDVSQTAKYQHATMVAETQLDVSSSTSEDELEIIQASPQAIISQSPQTDKQESLKYEIENHWNIARFLSNASRECFFVLIAEFLIRWKVKRKELSESVDFDENLMEELSLSKSSVKEMIQRNLWDFMRFVVVKDQFTSRMMEMVDDIAQYGNTQEDELLDHLRLSGYKTQSEGVEFIKTTCRVLSLDEDVRLEVDKMRKTLLLQVGVHEFSEEAIYHDPSASFVIHNVFCSACNSCSDIDVLRDESIIPLKPKHPDSETQWICQNCNHEFNMKAIEQRLLDLLMRRVAWYQVQDFRCKTTRAVSVRLLQTVSDTAAVPLVMDDRESSNKSSVVDDAQLLGHVAKVHNFKRLAKAVNWVRNKQEK